MIQLFDHQKEALEQTAGFQNIAIYYDMGLGKTFIGSEAMIRFGSQINLIICQKSKVKDWVEHFRTVYGFNEVYDLTNKKDYDHFFLNIGKYSMIAVINYELTFRRKDLLNLHGFTLMLDESSQIQNMNAKQTKFVMNLKPDHCILLSGTPVGGKYENLLSQLHLLGWDVSENVFNRTYINWKLVEDGTGTIHKVIDKDDPYKNVQRLKAKMRNHGAVFKKTEDVLDLPEQLFQEVSIDKTKEYTSFKKNHMVLIDGLELIGDTSLTRMLYERQLCGQYNQNKLFAFEDLIRSTNERIVVFYNFNEELLRLKQICINAGKPISEINGHNKDLEAYENESDSITLVQYQSGSKGLNLQKCRRIIYFTLPLSSENYEQSKKRIHRIGQENTCFYYILITKGSVEEKILETLNQRKDFTDELFEEIN